MPVVISAGLPVPVSHHGAWRDAAVVLHPQAVLRMRHASKLLAAVEGAVAGRGVRRVCRAQRRLRSDMRAEAVAGLLGSAPVAGCAARPPGGEAAPHATVAEVLRPT